MLIANNSVFLSKLYSDEELAHIANSANEEEAGTIVITRDIALNAEMIGKICKYFRASDIRISIPIGNTSNSTIFDESETEILKQNFATLESNKFKTLFVEGEDFSNYSGYTLDETLQASNKISQWAKKINSARIFGREFSPLEKFIYAYELVTNFAYQKSDDATLDDRMDSRNLVKVLNGDKIVCIGYASMLAELCKRIGIPCIVQLAVDAVDEKDDFNHINHAICKVFIDDELYHVRGMFNSDPSKDSNKEGLGKTINHALLTDEELNILYSGKIRLAGESWFYAETMNKFMQAVTGDEGFEFDKNFNISNFGRVIDEILIDSFAKNAESLEKFKNSSPAGKLEDKQIEEMFFSSIYDELYRLVVQPDNKYLTRRLEMLIVRAYISSNLSLDELFAELIDYGNRYSPDDEMLEEIAEKIEDKNANMNYNYMQEISASTIPMDSLMIFEALSNVYYERLRDDDLATNKATDIFDNSVYYAFLKWNLKEASDNFFQEEAILYRSTLKPEVLKPEAPKGSAKTETADAEGAEKSMLAGMVAN